MNNRWGIWATVSGGVTGYRESWCRHGAAHETYATREDAEARAARYRDSKINSLSPATFTYEAREYGAAS